MAILKFKQEIVKVKYNGVTRYINVEDVEWTEKMESDEYAACNDVEPYAVAFGKKEYSIDFKGVDPDQRWIFQNIMKYQRDNKYTTAELPSIVTYRYDAKHNVIPDTYFKECYIEEISQTTQEPFDVKFKALKLGTFATTKKEEKKEAATASTKA